MDEKKIAIKIYKESLITQDLGLLILQIFNFLKKETDINAVINYYKSILNKEIILANVSSRFELDSKTKTKLEEKIKSKNNGKDVLIDYEVNPKLGSSLIIKIGDDVLSI